jgi:hypothetical protein
MAGNLYDKAQGQKGLLQRIGSHIPGFAGYMDRETRRDADKMERDFVAEKLSSQKNAIKRTVDDLMTAGNYDGLAQYEKLMNKLDKVSQKIKNASAGYSGLFDSVKIDDAALERIYQYDLGLVEAAKEVELAATELQGLSSDGQKASAKARQLSDLVDRIDDYFNKRSETIAKA